MAQFDIYVNPNKTNRTAYPYLVDVQNPVISDIATRIVIPLGKAELLRNRKMGRLTPEVEYHGERLLLLTPQITSVPANVLKSPVGSLENLRDNIVSALDFAVTGI